MKKNLGIALGTVAAATGVAFAGLSAGSAFAATTPAGDASQSAQWLSRSGEAAKVEANKRVVEKFMEDVLDDHNGAHTLKYVTPDMTWSNGTVGTIAGAQNVAGLFTGVVTAIPDLHAQVLNIVGQHDEVVVRLEVTGTLEKPILGLKATGQHLKWDAIDEYQLRDGKISHDWAADDFTAILNTSGTYKAPWIP
jgi:predicted ester cyclase